MAPDMVDLLVTPCPIKVKPRHKPATEALSQIRHHSSVSTHGIVNAHEGETTSLSDVTLLFITTDGNKNV